MIDKKDLLLSAMRALLDNIPSTLRFCKITEEPNNIIFTCVFNENANEEDIELLRCAGTEIIANYNEHLIEEIIIINNQTKPIDIKGDLIYKINENMPKH
ncbi:MAG: hypothetical protein JNL74_19880 [Fibrobacteres bacterium]|nr:hypothetical protein [Fibrobacterota bacterium]